MNVLETIFGNASKLRIVKLFLFNPDTVFDFKEISLRTKVSLGIVRRECLDLVESQFVKERSFYKEIKVQKNRKMVLEKRRVSGFVLNHKFSSLKELYGLFSNKNIFKKENLISRLSKGVKIDLLIISGFFLEEADSRVDMLVVGENIKEDVLEKEVKDVEAELGKEIIYAVFTTEEFKYRLSVFDKLLRDILDYKHEKLINKIGL